MDNQFSTIGYGLLLEETLLLLDTALESKNALSVRSSCVRRWPQKSESNKEKLWQHMKYRFLEIEHNSIIDTPFLEMFRKIRANDEAVQDLVFFQLCITTPILFETLSLLVTDSFLNTGEAVFSRYHLEQLLERKYERMPQSTRDRVRSILVKAGRLKLSKSNYSVTTYCPTEAVLGCQICKEEMPFRKRNGKPYFEKKEVLSRMYLPKEHEAQYLALCPLCAAKYEEFVKSDEDAMAVLKEAIVNAYGCEVPISLGDKETSIRFVETHYHDLRAIIDGMV
jgi:hypothetical protein